MTRLSLNVLLAAATASCVVSAQAANIKLSIQYAGSYASDFTPKGLELNALPAPAVGFPIGNLPTDIHEFNIFMTITGLAAGEDIEALGFDAVLGPGVTPVPVEQGGGYHTTSLDGIHDAGYKYDPTPDTVNGCSVDCLPVFSSNLDALTSTNDLKALTLVASDFGDSGFSAYSGAHYRHPGETEAASSNDPDNSPLGPNLYIGSLRVNWNGSPVAGLSFIGLVDTPNLVLPWLTRTSANVRNYYDFTTMNQSPNLQWTSVVPEPSTLLLLGIGAISLLGIRKIQVERLGRPLTVLAAL